MIPSKSIWSEAQARDYPRIPGETIHADIAIIGGGFAGLSAAYHLLKRQPGSRVVVLEAGRVGAGASGHTTGMLGPGVGQSLVALVKRFGLSRAEALYRATLRAVEYVDALVTKERIDCQLEMTGQMIVARTQTGRTRLATQAALMDQLGLPCETIEDEALERSIRLADSPPPQDDRHPGPAALRLPVAGILHPIRFITGLAERVTELGGAIFEGARVTEMSDKQPVRLKIKGGGEVVADKVVLATAGYTPELGLLRGRILPVHLQVLITEPMDARARKVVGWEGREGMLDARRVFSYFRLTADDRIVFGGGEPRYLWGGSTEDNRRSASTALDRLACEFKRTFLPEAKLRVAGGWTGVIGYVVDTLPAIHFSSSRPSVLHVVGWSGHGVALSIASGDWVARLICDGVAEDDLPWYRENPPLIPFEVVRWLSFRSGVKIMSYLDRRN